MLKIGDRSRPGPRRRQGMDTPSQRTPVIPVVGARLFRPELVPVLVARTREWDFLLAIGLVVEDHVP